MKGRNRGGGKVPEFADGMRLNRYLSRCGAGSRRHCDEHVTQGMVTVNGMLVTDPSRRLKAGERVLMDGAAVTVPELFAAVMNKPSGYETTMAESSRRPVTLLSGGMPAGAAPVGRLDIKTGGLLLWSNHGELIYRLTHPKWKVEREYVLVALRPVTPEDLKKLERGGYIQPGVRSKPLSVKRTGKNTVSLILSTGRNREVRRLASICGVPLAGLERIRYGNVELGNLERGSWRELTADETEGLYRQVGLPSNG